jgi:hypothetical protein
MVDGEGESDEECECEGVCAVQRLAATPGLGQQERLALAEVGSACTVHRAWRGSAWVRDATRRDAREARRACSSLEEEYLVRHGRLLVPNLCAPSTVALLYCYCCSHRRRLRPSRRLSASQSPPTSALRVPVRRHRVAPATPPQQKCKMPSADGSVFRAEFALRFVRPTFAKAFGSCCRFSLYPGILFSKQYIRGPL